MRVHRAVLRIMASAVLFSGLGAAILWTDDAIRNAVEYAVAGSIDLPEPSPPVNHAETFGTGQNAFDVTFDGKSPPCANTGEEVFGSRTTSTRISAKTVNGMSQLFVDYELSTNKSDPLLDCIRDIEFTQDSEFVYNHFGFLFVANRYGTSIADLSISTEEDGDSAKITARGTTSAVTAGSFGLKFAQNTSFEARNSVSPARVSVRGDKDHTIDGVEGALVTQQDRQSVELYPVTWGDVVTVEIVRTSGPVSTTGDTVVTNEKPTDVNIATLLFPLTALAPWYVFLLMTRKSNTAIRQRLLVLFGWLAFSALVIGTLTLRDAWHGDAFTLVETVLFAAIPFSLILAMRGASTFRLRGFAVGSALIAATMTGALLVLATRGTSISAQHITVAVLGGLVCAGLLPLVTPGFLKDWRQGLLLGGTCLASVLVIRLFGDLGWRNLGPAYLSIWAVLAYLVLRSLGVSVVRSGMVSVACLLLLSPAHRLLGEWVNLDFDVFRVANQVAKPVQLGVMMLIAANILLLAHYLRLLWRGPFTRTLSTTEKKGVGIGTVLIFVPSYASFRNDFLSVALCTLGLLWLLRTDRTTERLAEVVPAVHARLLRLDNRRRDYLQFGAAHHRQARSKIANHEIDSGDAARTQSSLDTEAGLFRARRSGYVVLRRAAQSSNGGYPAQANGRFGALVGLAVSLPFMVYEAMPWVDSVLSQSPQEYSYPLVAILVLCVHFLRWTAFGAMYGYFYPALRGDSPIWKAATLFAVLAPTEIIAIDFSTSVSDFLPAVAIKIGYLLVFCLCLGLSWEWRLASAAGVPWNRVRDFTRVRSLLVPVSTIAIASATVLATGFASAAVSQVIQTPATTQEQQPPTPGTVPTRTAEK